MQETERRMHIAQVLLSPRIGGAETLAQTLAREWEPMGVQSTTIHLDDEERPRGRIARMRALRGRLRELSPDVVIAHSYLPAVYARVVWGRRGPVHSVLHSASDDFARARSRRIERILRRWTASVVAVGQAQLDRYEAHFDGRVSTTVIPNGVGVEFQPRSASAPAPLVVATLARVASQKRPAFWNEVVRRAVDVTPGLIFQWWGPRSGRVDLDGFVDDPQLATSLFMGPTNAPADVLRRADILFHPSDREAHSIALLEAILTGMPVVYANSIEPPDDSPVWRFRYAADDPADAVRTLALVVNEWESVSVEAIEYAMTRREVFSARHTAERYLEWIRVLNHQKTGGIMKSRRQW